MTYLFLAKSLIMGIVEGVTEFLPISSTGHLIIVGEFIDFAKNTTTNFSILFETVIQLGAILAVVFNYKRKIFSSIKNLAPGQWGFKLWARVCVAFVPAVIFGFLCGDFIETHFFSRQFVSFTLIIGALLMLLAEKYATPNYNKRMEDLTFAQCLIVGMAQCMALFPGMSRSAVTIIGGLLVGLSAAAAAEFSFFLAIPTMFAASVYSLMKYTDKFSLVELIALCIGFVTSFAVALIVIRKFIKFLSTHKLSIFACYRLAVGFLLIILIWAFGF